MGYNIESDPVLLCYCTRALPGRKQYFCQNGVNFLCQLALQKKNLDDSSHLNVVETTRVPNMLLSLFPSW